MKMRMNNILLLGIFFAPFLFYSCRSSRATMTRTLFMQTREITIELPPQENILNGDGDNGFRLGEQVTFANEDNRSDVLEEEEANAKTGIEDMQYIDYVVVTASTLRRFAPERDGFVNVDFIIKVPKEFVSPQWRLSITPSLILPDTIVALEQVILKGDKFLEKQKNDQQKYEAYLASVLAEDEYDDVFLNRPGIAHALRSRQEFYYNLYRKRFREIEKYLSWRRMIEERYAQANLHRDGNSRTLYNKYIFKGKEQALRQWATDQDSTGTVAKYERMYKRKINFWPQYKLKREVTVHTFPHKYKPFYLQNLTLHNITNHATTAADSIQISEHHYFFHAIAENEMKESRSEEVKQKLLPFPMEENTRFVAVGERETDFIYYYTQPWPVSSGLERLKITVEGKVEAVDLSSFTLPPTDTLTYMVSSLAELADTTLVNAKEKGGYAEALGFLRERRYNEALAILQNYPDYNTALCLTCLGYHGKAYDILIKETKNANICYLLSIVCLRLGRSIEAKNYLLEAIELDPEKAIRAVIDNETASLIYTYNLQDKIREAEWRWMFDGLPGIGSVSGSSELPEERVN